MYAKARQKRVGVIDHARGKKREMERKRKDKGSSKGT
jgi:hypothetical protein